MTRRKAQPAAGLYSITPRTDTTSLGKPLVGRVLRRDVRQFNGCKKTRKKDGSE